MSESEIPRLSQICSKTFLFLTSFKRTFPTVELSESWVHDRIKEIFDEQKKLAEQDSKLYELYEKARYLLTATVDGVILNMDWAAQHNWNLLELEEYGTAEGGEKFFEFLKDPSYKDDQLLEIFYLCLAAGFQGMYISSPEELEEIRQDIFLKLKDVPRSTSELITPQVYEENMEVDMTAMPVVKALRLAIIVGGLVLFTFGAVWVSYGTGIGELVDKAKAITHGEYEKAIGDDLEGKNQTDEGSE